MRVKIALHNGPEAPKVCRCHMVIDENSEAEIVEWIDGQAE
jgi:hypothetical protein